MAVRAAMVRVRRLLEDVEVDGGAGLVFGGVAVEARLVFLADRGGLGRRTGRSVLRENRHEEEWQGREDQRNESEKEDLLWDA